ncbi:MAG: caspase family protein [Bacteroidales bacterium]|nr:caspase family protein [Bacteroidales bacterium]
MKRNAMLIGLLLWCLGGFAQVLEVESSDYSFSISRDRLGVTPSDVDVDIPMTKSVNDKTFVVIIANENYQNEQDVSFAIHDGETFKAYCVNTLGIPERQIRMRTDATLNNIRYEVEWLMGAMNAHGNGAKGVFYYSGHGVPDASDGNAFLLPVDGYMGNTESAFGLSKLFSELGGVGAESMTYFIDACFSGTSRDGSMIAEGRGVAIKSKVGQLRGKAVAFSAAQGNETAFAYNDKSHGMFTYFLLKKLKETKGNVSYGELAEYITAQVSKMSMLENSKRQTPVTTASEQLDNWRTLKLK